jgi:hypothetical protein
MRAILLALLVGPLACATTAPLTWDSATQLNGNRQYPHDAAGAIQGPDVDQLVVGQRDRAGNIHIDKAATEAMRQAHRF